MNQTELDLPVWPKCEDGKNSQTLRMNQTELDGLPVWPKCGDGKNSQTLRMYKTDMG